MPRLTGIKPDGHRLERAAPINFDYLTKSGWWSKVKETDDPDECWPWKLSIGSHGYGQTWDGVTNRLAHRVAWSLANGRQIPHRMTVDHLCFTKICCNPAHLRLLTNRENATLNKNHLKTRCPAGHEYSGDNLYIDGRGHRRCRACAAERRAA